MKNIKHIICIIGLFITVSSCSIDDIEPLNLLQEKVVIYDENSAQAVLNRVYNNSLREGFYRIIESITVADQYITFSDASGGAGRFDEHEVFTDNFTLNWMYQENYYSINIANYFIEAVERGDAGVTEARQRELVAEARFLRALTHFNLLRVFGQFYDLTSPFGVVINKTPIRSLIHVPRSTVQETYDLIIEDLEFATANITTANREHIYLTATTAQGMLARVQLYMKDFAGAATNALAVIENTSDDYALAATYGEIFTDKWEEETLLAPYTDAVLERSALGSSFLPGWKRGVSPSLAFTTLADDQDGVIDGVYDPRYTFSWTTNNLEEKYSESTFANTLQVLRMAEIYLIYAEAEARRSGGVLADALAMKNLVSTRAGVAPGDLDVLTDQAALLIDIREEKVLELHGEVAENWFDLVRYHYLGDIDALSLVGEETLDKETQLIYVLPNKAVIGNRELVLNPS